MFKIMIKKDNWDYNESFLEKGTDQSERPESKISTIAKIQ